MIDQTFLKGAAAAVGLTLSAAQCAQLDSYAELLVQRNQTINLTAITEPAEIAVKHFADSLSLLAALPFPAGAHVVDVGSGAGFPGLPLCIARSDLSVTLLDSLNKRVDFMNEVIALLGLPAHALALRAEQASRDPAHRERYDIAVSRAVAALPSLCEYCLPLVRPGGFFLAQKGGDIQEELAAATDAISLLGGAVHQVTPLTLSDGSARTVVTIKKLRQTPPTYPRNPAKIKKSPL